MNIRKVFIASSWADFSLCLQTKVVAEKLSETMEVIYFSQGRIGQKELKINDRLTVVEWPNKRPNKLKDFIFIVKKIIKEKPDALIAHFGATIIGLLASWLLGVKYRICWMHTVTEQFYLDAQDQKEIKRIISLRKKIYKLATHIIVQNEYARNDAILNYRVASPKIFKISNGIYPLTAFTSNNGHKTIRYIGRLDFSKGVDILLKAFGKIISENEHVILEIIGGGSELEKLREFVEKEKLTEKILFHGSCDYSNTKRLISEAYCIIVPSRMDNFPTVILEALSAGVPVIAANVGGIPDMIENEKEGYLVENENVDALAVSIKKMLEDTSMRNRMATQAKKTFGEKFSMENHVSKVMDLLSSLK